MSKEQTSLTLEIQNNIKEDKSPNSENIIESVPLVITIQSSSSGIDLSKAFCDTISVTRGDIVGVASYNKVHVLTDAKGGVSIVLHPSGTVLDNGFLTVSCPVAQSLKIYYRIDYA